MVPWNSTTQAIAVIALLFLTLGPALCPLIFFKKYNSIVDENIKIKYNCILSCLTMMICGTFLSLAFLDMIPDLMEKLDKDDGAELSSFTFGGFLLVFGILLMIVIDQILIALEETQIDDTDPIQRLRRQEVITTPQQPQPHETTVSSFSTSTITPIKQKLVTAFILVLSLCVHSVLEGLVIGTREPQSVMLSFTVIVMHKVFVAFGLGLNMAQSGIGVCLCIILSFLFSIMSPIGMVIGLSLHNLLPHSIENLGTIIAQGVSCGTFIYIVCFEMAPRELNKGRFRLLKLLMLIIGFSINAVIIIVLEKIGY